jgi:hypothetical protein
MWRELAAEGLTPSERVLAEEACRLADRCDKLDRILRGDTAEWLKFRLRDVDSDEQQAIALKLILAELRQSRAARTAPPSTTTGQAPAQTGPQPAGTAAVNGGAGGTLIQLAYSAAAKRRGATAATGVLPA